VWTIDLFFVLEVLVSELLTPHQGRTSVGVEMPTFSELVSFTTTLMEADASYRDLPYYRNGFDADARRVNAFFRQAADRGWNVSCREVPLETIVRDLELKRGVYICLVNLAYLACTCRGVGQCVAAASSVISCCCCFQGAGGDSESVKEGLVRKRSDGELTDSDTGSKTTSRGSGAKPCCLVKAVPYVGHYIILVGVDRARSRVLYRDPAQPNDAVCTCPLGWFQRARQSPGTDQDLIYVRLGLPFLSTHVVV
jgi:hypothetical protein